MSYIKDLRENNGYTQDYVAEFIGVSRITYCRYEADTRQLKAPELSKLADLYNVSADSILGRSTIPDNHDFVLSDEEKQLLLYFRKLNKHGKQMIIDNASAIAGNPDLTKKRFNTESVG